MKKEEEKETTTPSSTTIKETVWILSNPSIFRNQHQRISLRRSMPRMSLRFVIILNIILNLSSAIMKYSIWSTFLSVGGIHSFSCLYSITSFGDPVATLTSSRHQCQYWNENNTVNTTAYRLFVWLWRYDWVCICYYSSWIRILLKNHADLYALDSKKVIPIFYLPFAPTNTLRALQCFLEHGIRYLDRIMNK